MSGKGPRGQVRCRSGQCFHFGAAVLFACSLGLRGAAAQQAQETGMKRPASTEVNSEEQRWVEGILARAAGLEAKGLNAQALSLVRSLSFEQNLAVKKETKAEIRRRLVRLEQKVAQKGRKEALPEAKKKPPVAEVSSEQPQRPPTKMKGTEAFPSLASKVNPEDQRWVEGILARAAGLEAKGLNAQALSLVRSLSFEQNLAVKEETKAEIRRRLVRLEQKVAQKGPKETPPEAQKKGPAREGLAGQAQKPSAKTKETETLPSLAGMETLGVSKSGQREKRKLSLAQCIRMALQNNLDIQISQLDPQVREQDLIGTEATFDPKFVTSATDSRSESESRSQASVVEGVVVQTKKNETKSFLYSVGIEKKLITGADMSITLKQRRVDVAGSGPNTLNPYYDSDLTLKITQPLLKDGWFAYNRGAILIANNNHRVSQYQFKSQVINVISDVQQRYWNLVRAIEDSRVSRESLRRAEKLLESNKIQVEAGTMAPIEVLEAESGVASQLENVINAENEILDKEDELKEILDMVDGGLLSDVGIVPADQPGFEVEKVDLYESLRTALQSRPDLLELQVSLESKKIEIVRARNQLLPTLDLTATLNYNALGRGFGHSFHKIASPSLTHPEYYDRSVGLSLEIPLGNRSARSSYIKAKLQARQAVLSLWKKERQVQKEVRAAVRQIDTNIERVKATRKARELAAKKLEAEEKKFSVGRSTSLDVLQAQEDLAIAERNETAAIIDYNISLSELDQAVGATLEANDIFLQ